MLFIEGQVQHEYFDLKSAYSIGKVSSENCFSLGEVISQKIGHETKLSVYKQVQVFLPVFSFNFKMLKE